MKPIYLLLLLSASLSAFSQDRPNVLLVLTDDQGYGDIRLHGNDSIDTPVMNRLAQEGMRLDNFFVSPLCAPTRAGLLTGRYHLRTGAYWVTRGTENMRPEEQTLAELFDANDYATGAFGKWHNGAHYPYDPLGQGFDRFVGFCGGHWTNYFNTRLQSQDTMMSTEGFITDVLTDHAIEFIEQHQHESFFCYVPYNAPHGPFQVPDRYFYKYKQRGLTDRNAAIYGMVENVDDNLGRLLSHLDQLGIADNTIVIFITDNGPNGNRYNGGMRGRKAQVHEGGHRVPCFVRWPGQIPAGSVDSSLTAYIDLFPTLQELCGMNRPEGPPLDGISLAPVLTQGQNTPAERVIFTHVNRTDQLRPYPGAMRTARYRFLHDEGGAQLYDMIADPQETNNLATTDPQRLADMEAAYMSWFNEVSNSGQIDPPPIPIGYREAPRVSLPAHEAIISDSLTYAANPNGWAHDWIVNWRRTEDDIRWKVNNVAAGTFEVKLLYASPEESVGARLQLSVGDDTLRSSIEEAFIPRYVPSLDRVPGRIEAYEHTWGELSLGKVELNEGAAEFVLSSDHIPGPYVAEIKGLIITRADKPSLWPLAVLLISVIAVVIAIGIFRMHAFLALILAALVAGWLVADDAASIVAAIENVAQGFGKTAAGVGIIIALAAIIGMALMESGAADKIVRRMTKAFGESRAAWAMMVSGFLLSIPVFFDTVFFLLIPLAQMLALRTGKNFVLYVMAISAGGAITHSLVPPTPGPLLTAELLELQLGTVMLAGLLAGVLPAIVAMLTSRWLDKRNPIPVRESAGVSLDELHASLNKSDRELPGFWISLAPILLPVVLLAGFSILDVMENEAIAAGTSLEHSPFHGIMQVLGNKIIALGIGALLALMVLVRQAGLSFKSLSEKIGPPLEVAGVIILITSAGGAFGTMIRGSGIGEVIQAYAEDYSINYIFLAWAFTALIRIAQGSATVSLITGAGLMAAILGSGVALPYHEIYIFLAVGFGSITGSWMNDSGFWVVGKLSGFTERETLRTWTVLTTVISLVGLVEVWLMSMIWPMG